MYFELVLRLQLSYASARIVEGKYNSLIKFLSRFIHAAPESEISGTSISEPVITKNNIQSQAEAFTESLFTIVFILAFDF